LINKLFVIINDNQKDKNRTNFELSNNTTQKAIMSDNILQINIGKQIQKLRELKGLSQQDLAAKCNFEKSNMSRLEAGRVNPTISTLEKVANALNVSLVELFTF
jgi:ribosome-binding protein aMBF1 (putative translation factor)